MSVSRSVYCASLVACLALALTLNMARTAQTGGVGTTTRSCRAQVVGVRVARADERGFESENPLLRRPPNSWKVAGPGALQALIRHNDQKKSVLIVSDTASGESRSVPALFVSGPVRWSPEGKRLAVVSWRSQARAWVPIILTLATDSIVGPACDLMGTHLKWSPNGRWLAIDGRVPEKPMSLLWLMETSTGRCVVLDTMAVYATYDFGWSPDSRSLAVSKPSRLAEDEGVVAADLWLFNTDGTRRRLRSTPHAVERDPRWIDAKRIIFREEPDGLSAPTREMVMSVSWK